MPSLLTGKMGVLLYLDTILVPFSLFITIGYHAYLWRNFKNKPSLTTMGMNMLKRRVWLQQIQQGNDQKGMLAVQSLRNTLMDTILTATATVIILLSLAALTNNTYHASHLFGSSIFGSQSRKFLVVKYGLVSIFLLFSLLCSAMALGNLIDANFLINALSDFSSSSLLLSSSPEHTGRILERGFMLAVVANRMLCVTFPLLMWMLGPVPVAVSALALVRGLYALDFVGSFPKAS